MIPPIAKKYVKALFESADDTTIRKYYEDLQILNKVYSMEKMKNILLSPTISKNEKFDFIISLFDNPDEKFKNFIKILVINDRTNLISAICDELRYELSLRDNKFTGQIISSSQIDKKNINSIEEKLSSKFDSKIVLQSVKSDYPGIKIEIEDLGVEISFSIDRLKAQMTEHILKAI